MSTIDTTLNTLTQLVDELGVLKAQIAELQDRESSLKATLAQSGLTEIDGELYRCTVSNVQPAPKVDWKAVAERLQPSHQLITAHTSPARPYDVVKLSARKTSK